MKINSLANIVKNNKPSRDYYYDTITWIRHSAVHQNNEYFSKSLYIKHKETEVWLLLGKTFVNYLTMLGISCKGKIFPNIMLHMANNRHNGVSGVRYQAVLDIFMFV